MPTFPTSPTPFSVSPFGIIDPVLRYSVDQGYEVRRSRHSRSKRQYIVTYLDTATNLHLITDFVERETRGGALSFVWVYPYGHTITTINTATPNVLTTSHNHGLQTGDSVEIAGSSTHDGTYTITRVSATTFSLDGSSGGTTDSQGTVAFRLPTAVFQFEGDTMPQPEFIQDFGPMRNNTGLLRLALIVREEFA